LLSVLSDIIKRDADPNVRNEALRGIYRLRTDAAINTLIQLYDGLTDVKIKGEVMGNLLRRKGDNSKAIAKLVAIAKTEKEEELRGRAISQLANLKGDDGATNLAAIYDSLQDAKLKQRVIRALAYNKSRKAIDKLIQIAKNDPDPTIRQMAVRSLYGIDERLYLELLDKANTRISLDSHFKFDLADGDQLEAFKLKAFEQAHEALRTRTPRATQPPQPLQPAQPGHNF
jgi:HEAT repeat protein